MNTASRPGMASKDWSRLSCHQWRAFLRDKTKENRTQFEKQLLAVLSYGNQVACDYANSIMGSYHTYGRFHTIIAKLARLPRQPFATGCIESTAKVFDMSAAAMGNHLASCNGDEMIALCKLLKCESNQLRAIVNIPPDDMVFINTWRECCAVIQAQYEPMLERISKQLFQQWFMFKQAADRRDCLGEAGPAILKAVRGYRNTKVKFITYAFTTTRREIKRSIYRRFGKTAMTVKLAGEYARTEHRLLTAGKYATPADVYAEMGLRKSQVDALERSAKRRFMQEGELVAPLDELMAGRMPDNLPTDLIDLISSVKLPPLELAALQAEEHLRAYFRDENFSDVARRLGYSSQAVADALKRARIKIANKLLSSVKFSAPERAAFEGRLVGKEFYQIADATGLPIEGLRRAYAAVLERIHSTIGTIRGLAQ